MEPYIPDTTPEQMSVQVNQPTSGPPVSVVKYQPVPVMQVNVGNINRPRGIPRDWSTGLFGCFEDVGGCLFGLLCPCHSCFLASDMGEPCCTPLCAGLVAMRANFRGKHNLQVLSSMTHALFVGVDCVQVAKCIANFKT